MVTTQEGYKQYLKEQRKGEVKQYAKAAGGVYEAIRKVGLGLVKGKRIPKRYVGKKSTRKRVPKRYVEKDLSTKLRKGILGVTGALTGKQFSKPGKRVKSGRGRPSGTYKTRYVPGVGAVKVPTHIYRKMMSAAKSKRRLATAQRQARLQQQYEAEQIAMTQDPRFRQEPDEFLDGPDMVHEQRVSDIRQQRAEQQTAEQMMQKQIAEQRGLDSSQRGRGIIGGVLSRLTGPRRQITQQGYPTQGYPTQRYPPQQIRPSPKMNIISERSSILNTPNIFNKPGGFNSFV